MVNKVVAGPIPRNWREMDTDPLLLSIAGAGAGAGEHRRRPISGGWMSALFIIGVEVAERIAYYGASLNLITYLTGPLGESTAAAATAVNAWSGVASMMPLLGAFVADSCLGRYRTIVGASLLYVLSLGMLVFSYVLPTLRPPKCNDTKDPATCLPSQFQVVFFYISLYLMAVAQGGHKPCLQAFGADQFDENDPKELVSRSSFFNWWYFAMCGGAAVSNLILTYVQDNVGWGLGFGIPFVAMVIALIIFLWGTKTYRFYLMQDMSPFTRIGKALITLASRQSSFGNHPVTSGETEETCLPSADQSELSNGFRHPCPVKVDEHVESTLAEVKKVLRLFPIWATSLMYGVICAQTSTFFTKQGNTMDRRIGPDFKVPPAALQSIIFGMAFAFLPIYDRVLVPIARKISGKPSGITMLQRIGTGMLFSLICILVAALVEMKRLKTAEDLGLVDSPMAVIPMSLWWLVPQYVLYGFSEVFAMVGLQEFFYDQMPDALRSLGLALYLSIFGVGSFISSFLVSLIDKVTRRMGESWFSNNLNRGHVDYFYWLLTALSAAELVLYFYFAKSYVYKKNNNGAV